MDNLESSAEKRTSAQDSGSVAGDPDALAGYDSDVSLPSVSELRQCELEVGALLKVIADLNAKMGSLQAPSVGSSDRCNSLGRASCSTPAYSPSSPVAPAHYPPSSPLPPAFYPSMPGTTPDFQPSPGSIDFQPNPGSIDFQPSTGSPDFHPNPGSPAFHLSTGSPAFQYNPGLLDYSFPGLRNYSSMPGGSQAFYPSSGPPDGTLSPGCAPDYAPSPVPRSHPEEVPGIRSGTPALLLNRRGSGEVWAELQEALSTLERSASKGRSYTPVPQPIRDEEIRTQHLSAARDSWVRVTQVLEEMERDLGFSYRSALPPEERRHYQQEVLELHRLNRGLRGALQSRQQELSQSDTSLHDLEDDKKKLQEKLLVLKRRWLVVGSLSPPRSPSSCSSSGGGVSPSWGVSSPPFPASPLLLRRHPAAFPPAATGGDLSPSSPCPSPVPFSSSSAASPCPPGMDSETERLQRCLERLKARNERLTAALERRKGESEQISMALSRHEADNTALQMALRYCEECEENYVKLLELYEPQREQDVMETTDGPASWSPSADGEAAEELQSGRQTAEGAAPMGNSTHSSSAAAGEEVFSQQVWGLKERIGGLRRDRAALHIPEQGPQGGPKMSPDTGTLAGPRGQSSSITSSNNSTRGEKAALLYELVTVREEMSELRGAIRLTEKEKRCLEWTLVSQRAQDEAGALLIDSLRDELDHRSMEQQRESRSRERSNSGGGRGGGGGGGIPGPRNRTILRELQAISQRDQVMRRRMIVLRDSLDTRLSDSMALRRQTEEEVTRLTHAHSKISNVYRNARRKHREQIWRLEKQIAALSEHHSGTIAELQHTLNNMEDKREETVL